MVSMMQIHRSNHFSDSIAMFVQSLEAVPFLVPHSDGSVAGSSHNDSIVQFNNSPHHHPGQISIFQHIELTHVPIMSIIVASPTGYQSLRIHHTWRHVDDGIHIHSWAMSGGFALCGHDGKIIEWNREGSCLETWQ